MVNKAGIKLLLLTINEECNITCYVGVRLDTKRWRLQRWRMEESRQGLWQEHTCAIQLHVKSHESDFPFKWRGTGGRFPGCLERELWRYIPSDREGQHHTIAVISELLSTQCVLQLHHRCARRRHYRRIHWFPTGAGWVTTVSNRCASGVSVWLRYAVRDAKRICLST